MRMSVTGHPAKRDMNFVKQVDEGFKKLYG